MSQKDIPYEPKVAIQCVCFGNLSLTALIAMTKILDLENIRHAILTSY